MKKFLPFACALTLFSTLSTHAQPFLNQAFTTETKSPTWTYQSNWPLPTSNNVLSVVPTELRGAVFNDAVLSSPTPQTSESIPNVAAKPKNAPFSSIASEPKEDKLGAEITSRNPSFQVYTDKNVLLRLKNIGVTIAKVGFAYQFNGGAIARKDFSLTSPLAPNGSANARLAFSEIPNSSGGANLKIWVEKINDKAANFANGSDTAIVVLGLYGPNDGYNPRIPLVEIFTSSTCNFCKPMNAALDPVFLKHSNFQKFSLVKYQVNFPGSGDPYYTPEVGARLSHYKINSAPSVLVDGYEFGDNFATYGDFTTGMQEYIDAELPKAPIGIDIQEASYDATDFIIYLKTVISSQVPGAKLLVYSALVEKLTTGNRRGNGETEFHNVMMKMLPDAKGSIVQLDETGKFTLEFTYQDIGSTHFEEVEDLHYVVYIFDPVTGDYIQSFNKDLQLKTIANKPEQKSNTLSVYPNPCIDYCTVELDQSATVQVYDIAGRLVYEKHEVKGQVQINTQGFASGPYVLRVIEPHRIRDTKLIKQ